MNDDKQANKEGVVIGQMNEITIDPEETKHAREFFKEFGIPIPDSMEKAMTEFMEAGKDKTLDAQRRIKLFNNFRNELCNAMVTSEHEVFKDEIWNEVKENSKQILFDYHFDNQVDEVCKTSEAK